MFKNFRKPNEIFIHVRSRIGIIILKLRKKSWQLQNSWLVALFMSKRTKLDDSHGNKISVKRQKRAIEKSLIREKKSGKLLDAPKEYAKILKGCKGKRCGNLGNSLDRDAEKVMPNCCKGPQGPGRE